MDDKTLMAALSLSPEDVEKLQYFDAEWDTKNETWIPSTDTLPNLIREALGYVIGLSIPRKKLAKK